MIPRIVYKTYYNKLSFFVHLIATKASISIQNVPMRKAREWICQTVVATARTTKRMSLEVQIISLGMTLLKNCSNYCNSHNLCKVFLDWGVELAKVYPVIVKEIYTAFILNLFWQRSLSLWQIHDKKWGFRRDFIKVSVWNWYEQLIAKFKITSSILLRLKLDQFSYSFQIRYLQIRVYLICWYYI